jgi:hypothetical protein
MKPAPTLPLASGGRFLAPTFVRSLVRDWPQTPSLGSSSESSCAVARPGGLGYLDEGAGASTAVTGSGRQPAGVDR